MLTPTFRIRTRKGRPTWGRSQGWKGQRWLHWFQHWIWQHWRQLQANWYVYSPFPFHIFSFHLSIRSFTFGHGYRLTWYLNFRARWSQARRYSRQASRNWRVCPRKGWPTWGWSQGRIYLIDHFQIFFMGDFPFTSFFHSDITNLHRMELSSHSCIE